MRKTVVAVIFLLFAMINISPRAAYADQNLVEYQIAAVLMNEAHAGGKTSMSYVAEVIRNRMLEQQMTYGKTDITYADILFNSGGIYANAFSGSDEFNTESIENISNRWKNTEGWDAALILARQTVSGTLPGGTNGANEFSKTPQKGAFYDKATGNYFYNVQHSPMEHDERFDEKPEEEPTPKEPEKKAAEPHYTDNSDASKETGGCKFSAMKQIYMDDADDAKLCWYCNVVIVLMNSFFQAAGKALPSAVSLGKLILQLGFLVWLAYFILQQLASFTPITIGKMLQDILKMGFKVALAYLAVERASSIIAYYFINPVLDLGISYGLALFSGMTVNVM